MANCKIFVNSALSDAYESLTHLLRTFVIPVHLSGRADGETMYQFLSNAAIQAMYNYHIVDKIPGDEKLFRHLVHTYYTPSSQSNVTDIDLSEENRDILIPALGQLLSPYQYDTLLKHRGQWKRTLIVSVSVGWMHETLDDRLANWCAR